MHVIKATNRKSNATLRWCCLKLGDGCPCFIPKSFVLISTVAEKSLKIEKGRDRTGILFLLSQGYEIHVTKSVKPEPVHMKDILACSGATFLPKMPTSPKVPHQRPTFSTHAELMASPLSVSLACQLFTPVPFLLFSGSNGRDFM